MAASAVAFDTHILPTRLVTHAPEPFLFVGAQFAFSCGYFIADSVMLAIFRIPQWQPVLVHHILAIIGKYSSVLFLCMNDIMMGIIVLGYCDELKKYFFKICAFE